LHLPKAPAISAGAFARGGHEAGFPRDAGIEHEDQISVDTRQTIDYFQINTKNV
jgi:hypothetical protein